jgi:agmatine deiminase
MSKLAQRDSVVEPQSNLLLGATLNAAKVPATNPWSHQWVLPVEGSKHRRTWMAYPGSSEVYKEDAKRLEAVRNTIAEIARTIARFEEVVLCVNPDQLEDAKARCGDGINCLPLAVDDLWIRDSGPVFVVNEKRQLVVADFNFNGWGDKQLHVSDGPLARRIAQHLGVWCFGLPIVGEGGTFEIDGEGTFLATESSIVNPNRNPGHTREDIEQAVHAVFGTTKAIWLPGRVGLDITDAHNETRFPRPGVVLAQITPSDLGSSDYSEMQLEHLALLKKATDAKGRNLEVVVVEGPRTTRVERDDFASSYTNYYVCNGAVISAEFGDPEADAKAKATLEKLYPGRQVIQLNIDAVASNGGGIWCATQQEPLV